VPLIEDSPLRERPAVDGGPDAISFDNVEVEHAAAGESDLAVTVLRLPATHGPGDPNHRLGRYLRRMHDGRAVIVLEQRHAEWRWVRGYVDNVAAAIALAVEDARASGRIYNVAEQHHYTEAEWVRRIGDTVGWTGEVLTVPDRLLPEQLGRTFDFQQQYVVDSSRIRRELDYREHVDEDEGLRRTIAWELRDLQPASHAEYAAEDIAARNAV
jgi:nucleoside-diphosphate-sugar epimerase